MTMPEAANGKAITPEKHDKQSTVVSEDETAMA